MVCALLGVLSVLVLSAPAFAQAGAKAPNPLPAGLDEEANAGASDDGAAADDDAVDGVEPVPPDVVPSPPLATEPPPAAPTPPTPPTPTPTPTTPPPEATPPAKTPEATPSPAASAPRTVWEPFDSEVVRTADGSMRVCSAIALPLTIVPGVGDIVGTVADWFCIIPAAIAVDYAGAFHGERETHFWQPALALVLKKGFETLVDTPIIVVTVGALVAVAAGGVAAVFVGGLPITLVTTGAVAITLAIYLALRTFRNAIGNFIFQKTYNVLVDEASDEALAPARDSSGLQPGLGGVPGGFGLMATVAGSRPAFDWAHAVPIVGPVWRADVNAENIKRRLRRYSREVLLVDKPDLGAADASADILAGVQGYAMAVGHVGIGVGAGLFGAGLVVALTDENDEGQGAAEVLGGLGIVSVLGGVAGVVVSTGAERLQPVVVPIAWGAAADPTSAAAPAE
jgi:hypothetical protein